MESALEGAGALATATAAAAVIETPAPGAPANDERCPNCGATVTGTFCASCGQQAHVHRSLSHAVEELLHGVWHFDSKLWNTLPLLVLRPGKLTRDYVMGKRARYISPIGLFLLAIFSMFFVFGLSGGAKFSALNGDSVDINVDVKAQDAVVTAEQRARMADLDRSVSDLDRDIAAAEKDPARAGEVGTLKLAREGFVATRRVAADAAAGKLRPEDGAPWANAVKSATDSGNVNIELGNGELEAKVRKALKNPELALYKIQQKGYKLSFLLLPLSLPWMMLLFAGRRDVRAYDHVVFLLYSISFMSMLVVATWLLLLAGVEWPGIFVLLAVVVPPVHMFLQVRGAYALSTFSALWRAAALMLLSLLTLTIYFTIILMLGLLD